MVLKPTNVRPRAADLYKQMTGGALYRKAAEEGMSLSAWLEQEDPSKEYNDGTDAFQRQIVLADIFTRSLPELGIWADDFSAFDESPESRALVPEWLARQARSVAYGKRPDTSKMEQLRSIFLSSDFALNTMMRPYTDDANVTVQQITPQIPVSSLVARTTGISGDAYRAFYLTRVTADLRMARVVEATEVPKSTLTGGEHTIRLYKYGRALESSYEQLRRMKIDLVALFVQMMAVQAEVDKVGAALSILVNGDGNSGTAPVTTTLTSLDAAAVAGTLTLKAYLRWKMRFLNPYVVTTILAQEESLLQAMLLSMGTANIPLVAISGASGFGGFTAINPGLADNVRVGWTADAPALKLVGFDNRLALEHVTEIGGDITEIERFANRQTQELIMTTVDGFRTLDGNAVQILDLNA